MDAIFVLHGYYVRASVLKESIRHYKPPVFKPLLSIIFSKKTPRFLKSALFKFKKAGVDTAHMHDRINLMLVFYSLLFVLIEGYQDLKISNKKIDDLLAEDNGDNLEKLRRFRNAIFHFQKEPVSPKLFEFLDKSETEIWTQKVFSAFNVFFSDHMRENWGPKIEDMLKHQP